MVFITTCNDNAVREIFAQFGACYIKSGAWGFRAFQVDHIHFKCADKQYVWQDYSDSQGLRLEIDALSALSTLLARLIEASPTKSRPFRAVVGLLLGPVGVRVSWRESSPEVRFR